MEIHFLYLFSMYKNIQLNKNIYSLVIYVYIPKEYHFISMSLPVPKWKEHLLPKLG